jgi:hypothetical protein
MRHGTAINVSWKKSVQRKSWTYGSTGLPSDPIILHPLSTRSLFSGFNFLVPWRGTDSRTPFWFQFILLINSPERKGAQLCRILPIYGASQIRNHFIHRKIAIARRNVSSLRIILHFLWYFLIWRIRYKFQNLKNNSKKKKNLISIKCLGNYLKKKKILMMYLILF